MARPRLRLRGGELGTSLVVVEQFIPLAALEEAIHQGGAERATTEVFSLTEQCCERMLSSRSLTGHVIRGTLARWRLNLGVSLHPTGCPRSALQVAIGLVHLLRAECWSHFALSPKTRWDRFSDISGLHTFVREQASTCDNAGEILASVVPPAELQPNHSMFSALADDLCKWVGGITSVSDDPDDSIMQLEQYIIWLNSMREVHSTKHLKEHAWERAKTAAGRYNKATHSFGRYRSAFLLQCVLFSFSLKSSSTIAQSLLRAFAVLPPFWTETLKALFTAELIPSGPVMCRARLYLDASLMKVMRDKHRELVMQDVALYVLIDSSPMGLQNWEMTESFGMHGQLIRNAVAKVEQIMRLQIGEVASLLDLVASIGALDEIRSACYHHVFPPTALGVRHATLTHKTHAVLHSFRLESHTWNDVQALLDKTFSITSDMGNILTNLQSQQGCVVCLGFAVGPWFVFVST
jgi:hypothetical protein